MERKSAGKENMEKVSDFNIKDFFKICISKWLWFLICLACSVGIALFYIYSKEPEYERMEQILVNEQESNGGMEDISNAFSTLGLFSKNTNVYNELITMTSPSLMYSVADSLQLYMDYFERDGLRNKTLYGSSLPFRIDFKDIGLQEGASLRIKELPDGNMEFFKFQRNFTDGEKIKYHDRIVVNAGESEFESPLGKISISPNPNYISLKPLNEEREIRVFKNPMQSTVEEYGKQLKGDLADQDADVIDLSIEDVSVQRAIDILNCILIFYNRNWVKDKNRMAVATSAFIDERLRVIQRELGEVDSNIADYMNKTGTPDLETAIQVNLELSSKMEEELIKASNQLSIARYMQDFLANSENRDAILPVNLGLEGVQLNTQIVTYNELLMARNNILNNSSLSNPLVQNYDTQLASMKKAIENSVANQVENLQRSVNNIQKEIAGKYSALSKAPKANLPLLSEERQQAVKEALYLFLLQKREENELTQKFSADNIRVITPPVGSLKPVAPRKALIIIIALIIGLGVPLIVLYFLETMNTTVRNKDDLQNLLIPFAGEVPFTGKKKKLKLSGHKSLFAKEKDESKPVAIVEAGKRDVVNEAFRVVRGNLNFMNGKSPDCVTIMVTSVNPGSGKSFVTYNLALSYCLKNHKVLIIDCDLRHGSSSMVVDSPRNGIADFLSGATDNWKQLLKKSPVNDNLDILPVGKIPPNPAELLEDDKLKELIKEAKNNYNLILLDCPPVNIVVDTQIISELADRTIFVVRAGLLEKSALQELNEFYEEKKFKNMCVILNGTEAIHSRYYTYGNYQGYS